MLNNSRTLTVKSREKHGRLSITHYMLNKWYCSEWHKWLCSVCNLCRLCLNCKRITYLHSFVLLPLAGWVWTCPRQKAVQIRPKCLCSSPLCGYDPTAPVPEKRRELSHMEPMLGSKYLVSFRVLINSIKWHVQIYASIYKTLLHFMCYLVCQSDISRSLWSYRVWPDTFTALLR